MDLDDFSNRILSSRRRPLNVPDPCAGEESLNVLCINCQEFIHLDVIELHSRSCTTISDTVKQLELYSPLVQVRFRLEKLKDLLNSLLSTRPGDSNYNSIYLRLIGKLLEVRETADADKNAQVMEALTSLMVTFKGSPALLIYGERLKSLAYEQSCALRDVLAEVPVTRPSRPFQKSMQSNGLASVRSKTSSVASLTSEFGKSSSRTEDHSIIEFSNGQDASEEVDLQRYFYSQCLAVKLTYNSKSLAQYVSIPKLYEEVKRQRLPLEVWASFIKQELKYPDRWVDSSKDKKSKHSQPKNLQRIVRHFDPIEEEEGTPRSRGRR
jgi:hypothetical protein